MPKSRIAVLVSGVVLAGAVTGSSSSGYAHNDDQVRVPGLRAAASVVRDVDGVAHVKAATAHDVFFLQGWVHAQDRMFQMDVTRRRASGTLAELLGTSALPSDVQMRRLGLHRAAERTVAELSRDTQDELRAYADGVNAWLARNEPPRQYADVQVSKVEPWSVVDSVLALKLITFSLSFDLDIDRTTAVRAFDAAGLDGHTAVFGDLSPFTPFNQASPVIDATQQPAESGTRPSPDFASAPGVTDAVAQMAAEYLQQAEEVPVLAEALNRSGERGSNAWVIGGQHTANGRPILASDPHLGLDSPPIFYPIELDGGGFDVQGTSIPGSPYIVLGQNRDMTFGSTQHLMDVTDTYVEEVQADPASPSGLSTVYQGQLEPVVAIDETFRVNPRTPGRLNALDVVPPGGAIPAQTLIVPRRNNGPLLTVDRSAGTALSVQYTGFSPTTELDAFRGINLARDVDDFRDALQYFDIGGQHFVYADRKGNIAYFTNAEVPVREDLQAGAVDGNPPYLLRDGTGGNEWLPVQNPQPHQSVPYEIVPFDELPQTVNPPAGFIVSANNDPTGNTFDNDVLNQTRPDGGISYLSFFHTGFRAGRVTDMVRAAVAEGGITPADVANMQADTTTIDGQFFTPIITAAFDRAQRSSTPELAALAHDPRVVEAVDRLALWNHTYPTGVPEGYDAIDRDGRLSAPSQQEIDHSVAATIYALWRGRFAVNVLDDHVQQISPQLPVAGDLQAPQALRQLLLDFDVNQGVGRSGIDFFATPGIADAADRRDFFVLKSLADALDLAASNDFDSVFGGSTQQSDYRWGKLHRITFTSPLGAPYTIPSPGNPRVAPLPGLPGLPVDGGSNVPDTASHPLRADTPAEFTVPLVPNRRFVAEATPSRWRSVDSLTGGVSEDPTDPSAQNLLGDWLTNETYPVRMYPQDLAGAVDSITRFVPKRGK